MNKRKSHPSSMNCTANQSNSSGWLGSSPCVPKSELVLTKPVPKNCCQIRLTITREVRGVIVSNQPIGQIQAIVIPVLWFGRQTRRKAGTPRDTFSPGLSYCPRTITKLSLALGRSAITKVEGISFFKASFFFSISSFFLLMAASSSGKPL